MSIDSATIDRLRELAEAGKAGGWQEVVAALDMGDIILTIRDRGDRGAIKEARQATGMARTTLWRRAKLAEHRELVERERPANVTEALRLVQKLEAKGEAKDDEADGEPEKAKGGRPKRDPLEVLKGRLCSTVAMIAQQGLMREADVILAVRGAYRAGVKAKAEYEAAARDQEEIEADAEKAPADVIPLAQRKRPKLAVVDGGAASEPAATDANGSTRETEGDRLEPNAELVDIVQKAIEAEREAAVQAAATQNGFTEETVQAEEPAPGREVAIENLRKAEQDLKRWSRREDLAKRRAKPELAKITAEAERVRADVARWKAIVGDEAEVPPAVSPVQAKAPAARSPTDSFSDETQAGEPA